jgi:hypothetical protein
MHALNIRILALAGGMLDGEDNNFLGFVVSGVINQISISARYQLPHAGHILLPSDMRKQQPNSEAIQGWCL